VGSLKANPKFENRKPNMRAVRAQEQLNLNTESLALVNNLWIFPHSLMTKYSVINKNLHIKIIVVAMAIHHHIFFLLRVSQHQKISLTG
jgi:hypothetical protein